MANLVSSAYSDNEGASPGWAQQSGTVTVTNSTDYAQTGTKSLKMVSGAASSFKVGVPYGDRFACSASTLYPVSMYQRATAARYIDWGVDYYDSGGGYVSTDTFSGANADTSTFTQISDTTTTPGTAASFAPWIQFDANATSQTLYMDVFIFGTVITFDPSRMIFVAMAGGL